MASVGIDDYTSEGVLLRDFYDKRWKDSDKFSKLSSILLPPQYGRHIPDSEKPFTFLADSFPGLVRALYVPVEGTARDKTDNDKIIRLNLKNLPEFVRMIHTRINAYRETLSGEDLERFFKSLIIIPVIGILKLTGNNGRIFIHDTYVLRAVSTNHRFETIIEVIHKKRGFIRSSVDRLEFIDGTVRPIESFTLLPPASSMMGRTRHRSKKTKHSKTRRLKKRR